MHTMTRPLLTRGEGSDTGFLLLKVEALAEQIGSLVVTDDEITVLIAALRQSNFAVLDEAADLLQAEQDTARAAERAERFVAWQAAVAAGTTETGFDLWSDDRV